MKRLVLAAVASAALGSTAYAADLGRPYEPVAAPVYAPFDWTGFYIGAHAGGAWATHDWSLFSGEDANGFIGGLQLGYNWQWGTPWVLGLEADIAWTDLGATVGVPGFGSFSTDVNWLSTVTGRVGYAVDRTLFYVKGGVAFADVEYRIRETGFGTVYKESDTRTGWTIGAGAEWAFADNWSAKLEYNYIDLGGERLDYGLNPRSDTDIHAVKVGLNYRF